jgi:hypothetical protein
LAYHKQDIERIAKQYHLRLESRIGEVSAGELLEGAAHSRGEGDWRDSLHGGCLSIFFQSTLDRMPAFLKVFTETAAEFGITTSEICVYIQPMVQNHACHMELLIPCKPGQMKHLRQLERQATIRLMESGAFFSRP